MTPAEYLRLTVLPTLAELLAEPTDQRRAYLACIAAAHLVDHVAVRLPPRPDGKPDIRAVRSAIGRLDPHGRYSADCLAIVEAVSNGTKHALPDPKPNRPVKFMPGYERLVPAFALDVNGAGLDESRWDLPGLVVDHAGGMWFLDDCIRAMVRGCVAAFPDLSQAAPEAPKPVAPVSVKKSIGEDFIVSMEDGKRYKSLKRHLAKHGLTPAEYRAKWSLPHDYPMVSPAYSAARSALAKSMGLGAQRRKG